MSKSVKTAQVMHRFVPSRWSGVESLVFNVSKELAQQGSENPVFCTALFAKPGVQTLAGVRINRYRYVFPWLGLKTEARERLRLKGGNPLSLPLFFGLLREHRLSLIHTHVQHRLGGIARSVAKLKGIPYVVSLHGDSFSVRDGIDGEAVDPCRGTLEWGKVFGRWFGTHRVLNDAAAIVCVGESEYREVKRRYPFKNVFQVPIGVDVERFASADGAAFRAAYGYTAEERIVLCVSRIDSRKNQVDLVRAFARFSKDHPDHRLVLIGTVASEEYHRRVLAEIVHLGLRDVVRVIPGLAAGDPMLPSAYKAAEMFVAVPRHEPFGAVVLEAWAAGVPVAAYAVGGISGFAFDRENALLVEPGNRAQLTERMAEFAADASLRKKLAERAFAEASNRHDWPLVAEEMREIYARFSQD